MFVPCKNVGEFIYEESMEKKGKAEVMFLARDVAELIIKRYPSLSLYDIKSAMMSAEEFLLDSVYKMKKNDGGAETE